MLHEISYVFIKPIKVEIFEQCKDIERKRQRRKSSRKEKILYWPSSFFFNYYFNNVQIFQNVTIPRNLLKFVMTNSQKNLSS